MGGLHPGNIARHATVFKNIFAAQPDGVVGYHEVRP